MLPPLPTIDAVVHDAHAIPHAQLAFADFAERETRAIVESHGDAVAIASVVALDLVADNGTADRAGYRGRCVAAAAANLVTEQSAGDSTDNRAHAARRGLSVTVDVDRLDDAVLDLFGIRGPIVDGVRLRVCAGAQDAGCCDQCSDGCWNFHGDSYAFSGIATGPGWLHLRRARRNALDRAARTRPGRERGKDARAQLAAAHRSSF